MAKQTLPIENETMAKIKEAQDNMGGEDLTKYMGEMKKIRHKGRVDSGKIQVKEITDHMNISLWTKEGKRIGPLHPHNAERTFQLFWELGTVLSVDQPTETQIAAYKETDEYKKKAEAYAKIRKIKDKSRKAGQIQKYIEEIAKLTGQTAEAINHVLKPGEVKRLSEAR